MATNQQDLKDYSGSKEENLIRSVFKNIISDSGVLLPAFVNLVIKSSNAIEGKSFSDASVYLRLNYEHAEAYAKNYIEGYPECGGVYLKDILTLDIFKEFLVDGIDALGKRSTACRQSFLALFEFLQERRTHEEAIWKLAKETSFSGSKETQIMVGLAHHLFSQLVPGKNYEVDKYAKQLPKECGCGCEATIYGGNTSLGSARTWHGRVDIMLNHAIAVTMENEATDSTEENDDDDDGDAEPASKQRKLETDANCDIGVEVKHDNILESKMLEQVLAEAITNGFAQLNRNESTLLHFLIPTIGITSDHISVSLYDAESDCLLLCCKWLQLWVPEKEILANEIIVVVWLFLNFTVFTEKKVAAKYDLDKSGLHAELKNHLQHYRKVETKESFVSSCVPLKYSFCPNSK